MTVTRGVRNNNPGNIRRNPANKWQGRVPLERNTDPDFEQFISPEYGIRALAVLLITYYDKYGCDTIRSIIERWAPPSENDTDAYISAVARMMRVLPKTRLNLHDYDVLRRLVEAIIAHENAGYRYPSHVVDKGLELAGVIPTDHRAVIATDTVRGSTAATVATAVGAVVPQLAGLDWRLAVAIVLSIAVAAVIGVTVWRSRRL